VVRWAEAVEVTQGVMAAGAEVVKARATTVMGAAKGMTKAGVARAVMVGEVVAGAEVVGTAAVVEIGRGHPRQPHES